MPDIIVNQMGRNGEAVKWIALAARVSAMQATP
jgi:hypothetical protein